MKSVASRRHQLRDVFSEHAAYPRTLRLDYPQICYMTSPKDAPNTFLVSRPPHSAIPAVDIATLKEEDGWKSNLSIQNVFEEFAREAVVLYGATKRWIHPAATTQQPPTFRKLNARVGSGTAPFGESNGSRSTATRNPLGGALGGAFLGGVIRPVPAGRTNIMKPTTAQEGSANQQHHTPKARNALGTAPSGDSTGSRRPPPDNNGARSFANRPPPDNNEAEKSLEIITKLEAEVDTTSNIRDRLKDHLNADHRPRYWHCAYAFRPRKICAAF